MKQKHINKQKSILLLIAKTAIIFSGLVLTVYVFGASLDEPFLSYKESDAWSLLVIPSYSICLWVIIMIIQFKRIALIRKQNRLFILLHIFLIFLSIFNIWVLYMSQYYYLSDLNNFVNC